MANASGTTVEFRFNQAALDRLLRSRLGPVARMLDQKGARVESKAKQNATGPPHGYYAGTLYPSASGVGPGVRTGAGRSSITHVLGSDGRGLYCDVGAGRFYMGILEKKGQYVWLRPALSAARL